MTIARRLPFGLGAAMMAFMAAWPAGATWSVVAVDPETGEVGLAAASCSVGVQHIAALVPDRGAIVSQAASSRTGREKARELVGQGRGAPDVLTAIQDPDLYSGWFTIGFRWLQYGVATLDGGSGRTAEAGYVTGKDNEPWAGGAASETFSVQGNTLRGPAVVENAAQAFRGTDREACPAPLAERLLRALEAGRDAGGDKRCPADAPALAAVMMVAKPGDSADAPVWHEVAPQPFSLAQSAWHMVIPYSPDPDRPEPVAELRARYEASSFRRDCRGGSG